jgi:hypothetical protein
MSSYEVESLRQTISNLQSPIAIERKRIVDIFIPTHRNIERLNTFFYWELILVTIHSFSWIFINVPNIVEDFLKLHFFIFLAVTLFYVVCISRINKVKIV